MPRLLWPTVGAVSRSAVHLHAPSRRRGRAAAGEARPPRTPLLRGGRPAWKQGRGRSAPTSRRAPASGQRPSRRGGSTRRSPLPEGRPSGDTGRAMSQENVELVREGFARWNQGDYEFFVSSTGPDTELLSRFGSLTGEPYRGHRGAREWLADIQQSFREWS